MTTRGQVVFTEDDGRVLQFNTMDGVRKPTHPLRALSTALSLYIGLYI